jgi:predicted metal-binding membrane protein
VGGTRAFAERTAVTCGRRPEWRFSVLVAAAWAALIAGQVVPQAGAEPRGAGLPSIIALCPGIGASDHRIEAASGSVDPTQATPGILGGLAAWTLMAVAMMAPVALPAVRHVALNSIRRRRQRAMALYFVAYVTVWALFGVFLLVVARLGRQLFDAGDRAMLAVALALAAGWQLSRWKRRALYACGRTVPLPPVGRRADAGCVRFGLQSGCRSVRSCWALMAAVAVVGQFALGWMGLITAWVVVEEMTFYGRRWLRPSAGVLALAAGLVALGIT